MRSVLFAIVLVLNLGRGDGLGALAGMDISAAPQSSGPPSATQEVTPPDLQGFPTARAPDELGVPEEMYGLSVFLEALPINGRNRVKAL